MLLWRRAIWDPGCKQIFCLLFAEKLSYKVCDESLTELDKLSQGRKGMIWYSSFLTSCSRAPNCEWVPVFLMHSIETRMFNHSTCVFKFVFDRYGFTSVRSSSNLIGMHFEYFTSYDSSLHIHMSWSHALLEQ